LLGILDSLESSFNARKFVGLAIPVVRYCEIVSQSKIEDILRRGKKVIVVGGTHYYVEALLFFQHFADRENGALEGNEEESQINHANLSVEEARTTRGKSDYELLQELDPAMAQKLHPKDSRKIARSLEVLNLTLVRNN
jgi:tRNA A37 N6-isopentenylltransferase MiaA